MRTNRFDLLSFVFGALFTAVGVVGVSDLAVLDFADLRWIGPGILVLIGVALVISAARRDGPDEAVAIEDVGATDATDATTDA
ncbi:MAG TPA: hypothetical protein VK906_08845 [Egicoccus sp.]|nr:hypothetical protein [Egicoccus sp.]HSK23269.1 hypothetical protein [Egicoccus sp.]